MNSLLIFLATALIALAFGQKYSFVKDANADALKAQQVSNPNSADLKLPICVDSRELCSPRKSGL